MKVETPAKVLSNQMRTPSKEAWPSGVSIIEAIRCANNIFPPVPAPLAYALRVRSAEFEHLTHILL